MLEILGVIVMAIPVVIVLAIVNEPWVLFGAFQHAASQRRYREEAADRVQAEIERKCAIADQAIAARRRGELFVPPADYDR